MDSPRRVVSPELLETLNTIQKRVLWLATLIVHHANQVRTNTDGMKVGGHQASSASVVSIMTALYFHFLKSGDRVSVKPHASPVFHAIQYLLGQLPKEYLTQFRSYGGLQAYPSRTKDPDIVDFSTGSVGLGAVAPAFGALAHHYSISHFGQANSQRFVGLIGDAELDEGNVWEAILEQSLTGLGNLLWIVDLNRQSLDRVVPGIRAGQLQRLFEESGWQVLETKYGRTLQSLFDQPGGDALRLRIDEMSNEEYQAVIRLPGNQIRRHLLHGNADKYPELASVIQNVPDDSLPTVLSNLGGHDLEELLSVFSKIDEEPNQPSIIFAYTIKGWGLPIAGHPLNHSMLLNEKQIDELRQALDIPPDDDWAQFDTGTSSGQLCHEIASELYPAHTAPPILLSSNEIPEKLSIPAKGVLSTQQAFGRLLLQLTRVPNLSNRIITASPDVTSSTGMSSWVNKMGVFALEELPDYETEANELRKWKYSPNGQHIELGISEMNFFMMLGMFGLSAELCGQHVIPIGTVYDPFICRGLDALIYAQYSGAKFIFAGTPSGITLSPEGGAHQSSVTPSLGAELPGLNAYEPCFAKELEWILLDALRQCCDRSHGRSTYLRLSTKPIDNQIFAAAMSRLGEEEMRRQVLAGGYRLVDWRTADPVRPKERLIHIATTGTMIPEVTAAVNALHRKGIAVNVLNLTSARRLFEAWQTMQWEDTHGPFDWLIPQSERHAPIITVHDGASHALAWLGSVYGSLVVPLGVDEFGQSGARTDLYKHFGIDPEGIVEATLIALNRCGLFV